MSQFMVRCHTPVSIDFKQVMLSLSVAVLIMSGSACNAEELATKSFLYHAKSSFTDAFDSTGLTILLIGSAATALALTQDMAIHDTWKDHQRMSTDISRVGDFWGTGIPEAGIAFGQIYFDPKNGWPHAEGLIAGGIVVHTAKLIISRARPDSPTRTAFPSGHTQAAFSTATSIFMSYGWKVGVPFFGMAVFTGLTRLADNAHWLSDVVSGATVGVLFGRAGFKHHLVIAPTYSRGNSPDGFVVSIQF
ncbi:MAG: phosphatase PAP2 family protein [Bdellovibrionales bacterium]|nr:phosphatase PAP2 family protein [Bdellovibrionales bacterium]